MGQFGFGMMLLEGRFGEEQDVGSAVLWLGNAADGGFARAAEQLARLFAQGLNGAPQDPEYASEMVRRAEELGLSPSRLNNLRSDIDVFLNTDTSSQDTVATSQPPSRAPDGSRSVFLVTTQNGSAPPNLGDQTENGNLVDQVVYVAQGFNINRSQQFWVPTSVYMIGQFRLPINEYSARTLYRFLETSELQRGQGDFVNLQNFTTPDEGIRWRTEHNNFLTQYGDKMRWPLAEVEGIGLKCSHLHPQPIHPIPIRDERY